MKNLEKLIKTREFQNLVIVLFIVWFVFFVAKRLRLDKGRIAKVDKSNLDNNVNYSGLARRLYNTMNGLSISGKTDAMNTLLELNDDEFKEVYNLFNGFINKSSETLRDWIEDEWMPHTQTDEEVIRRINSLGLA